MLVTVDMARCESHGQCVFSAPEVFSFDDEDYLVYDGTPPDALSEKVQQASASCPVRAITISAGHTAP